MSLLVVLNAPILQLLLIISKSVYEDFPFFQISLMAEYSDHLGYDVASVSDRIQIFLGYVLS